MQAGLAETRKGLQELASSLHNLSHELHPAKLKLLGLDQTLEALCRDVDAESGVRIDFERAGDHADMAESVALCIFRITQEALQNGVKHSGARHIGVRLIAGRSELTLRIVDDGNGFDPLSSQSTGIGLLTMRERVELEGGFLRIATAPGRGTTIEAIVPVKNTTAADVSASG